MSGEPCDECGKFEPDVRETFEGEEVWDGEDEYWYPPEYHCANCRYKLGREPVD